MPDHTELRGSELDRALCAAQSALTCAIRGRARAQEIIERQLAHLADLRSRLGAWESRIVALRADVAGLKLQRTASQPAAPLTWPARQRAASEVAP